MIFPVILCATFLLFSRAFSQAQNLPSLTLWEEVCLLEHNAFRVAHNVTPVSWDIFMHSLADVKALNLVLEDQNIDFRAPGLAAEILASEYISFSYEITTRKSPETTTKDKLSFFLANVTSDIIRSWYNSYFLAPTTRNKEKRDRILDPYTVRFGCTVHALRASPGMERIFLTVAYQQDKKLMAKFKKDKIKGRGVDLPPEGGTCTSNCTIFGSCYSHRASEGFLRSRVGTGSGRSMVGVVKENCRCDPDPALSDDGNFFRVPHCEGPCFVSCPLASTPNKKSCQGITKCTCKYSSGGAYCD